MVKSFFIKEARDLAKDPVKKRRNSITNPERYMESLPKESGAVSESACTFYKNIT